MRLFISYSRDDKQYVYTLDDDLRQDYAVWIDKQIVGGTAWWDSILDQIEHADCVICALSPRAVESIYCRAELEYALALNKPIIPLLLKTCDYPKSLQDRQIQHIDISAGMSHPRVLILLERAIGQIRSDVRDSKYPSQKAKRPPVPQPTPQEIPQHVYEVFAAAEEDAASDDLDNSERLFNQVAVLDPQGLGIAATARIAEIQFERERARDYAQIVRLAGNSKTLKGAKSLWENYARKYGTDYDPQDLAANLNDVPKPPSLPEQAKTAEKRYEQGLKLSDDSDEAYYTEAIRLNPQDANAYIERGNARNYNGDLGGAIADYTEAIRLNPQGGLAYFNRGIARSDNDDLDGAIADYTEAIHLNLQDADAYNNRGMTRHDKGDLDGAIADYTEAIRLNPQDSKAYLNRAVALYDKGDLDGAIPDYEAALKINPKNQSTKKKLAEVRKQKRSKS